MPPPAEWSSTARALAGQFEDEDDYILPTHENPNARRTSSPIWSRRSLDSPSVSNHNRPRTTRDKWLHEGAKLQRRGLRLWTSLTPIQRAGLVAFGIISSILTILALIYSERIMAALAPAAKKWRALPGGWLILWFMTFFVSFPPMIGYSTCVTIAGFVFGMKGWFIMASATIIGSTVSFIVSRTLLKNFVSNMTEKNQQFAALSLVLKHDGLKLLCMIRLCPLPYSFANGAISTIPTVTWQNFMLATAIASPKLLLHIFVGSRLGDIAERGDEMDFSTKIVSYISIIVGMVLGIATGYIIYARTKARAKVLEAEEAANVNSGARRRTSSQDAAGGPDYLDEEDFDDDERAARDALRSRASDISLHRTRDRDYADEDGDFGAADLERGNYRDEFTDDEDAQERDVFDVGDGETTDEEGLPPRKKG